ncbi:MAG: hypothetical protein ACOY0R_20945 [Chloroflexota bacterium]
MFNSFDGLLWFVLALLVLLWLQRTLHREIQAIFLIVTRHPGLTMGLFSVLFFPGVFLHELSHFLMAKLLMVPTGGFSLIPQPMPDGRLQLGYVETAQTDVARDSLIGIAPLLTGGLTVALIAIFRLNLLPLWELLSSAQFERFWAELALVPQVPDFALWFYLTFAVSSTMMPSQSDRHAWLPLGLLIVSLLALALFAGAGPWMLATVTPPLNAFLRGAALVFALSALVHGALSLPLYGIHRLLTRVTGLDVR